MYCYSFDEERFTGCFASLEHALDVAKQEGLHDGHETVWIGEQRHPEEWITAARVGQFIEEHIGEELGEEVGEVAENFALTEAQQIELGQLVLNWIEAGPKFNCYGVKNITQHSLVEPKCDTLTKDMFAGQEGGAA